MSMIAEHPHEASRHKCLIYDGDPSEQLPVIVPLLMEGLESRRRCLYLGDPPTVRMVEGALGAKGLDVGALIRRKALLFSSDRSHLDKGFDPRAMVDMLCGLIDDAVRDGFQGLCATGDMRWELGPDAHFDRLLEYETLLDRVFLEKPLMGICQYHRDTVPARAVQEALMTHPSAYIGGALNQDNLFYIPPDLHDEAARDKRGEWMCRQIIRVQEAEHRRDEALRALSKTNQQLEQRVRERTAELENSNQELEAFSYSVSHDLRAPLRSIQGFSDALLEDHGMSISDGSRDCLDRIRGAANRMSELIDGMLSLSRLSRGEFRAEPVDLSAMAREILHDLARRENGRQVEAVLPAGLAAQGDRRLLRAVMENLLGNAWKFTSKRSRTRIEVGRAGTEEERAVFFVKDNGAGFDMAYANKLFGTFQRLHDAAEFPGTGVGLASVQRVVQRHGGRVWAESVMGNGATFYFTLPEPPKPD